MNYDPYFLNLGPIGTDFDETYTELIPEALQMSCSKCTPKQRQLIRVVVAAYKEKLPAIWEKLVETEDPEGKYKEDFDKFLAATD